MKDPVRIIVGDNGFVWVGRCPDPRESALWLTVTDSRTIRVWGTTEGLAQLYDGPVGNSTKLDALVPERIIPVRAILDTFLVREDKWAPHLTAKKSR